MMEKGRAALKDILLLFIYLELGAMIGIYFKTQQASSAVSYIYRHHCAFEASGHCCAECIR